MASRLSVICFAKCEIDVGIFHFSLLTFFIFVLLPSIRHVLLFPTKRKTKRENSGNIDILPLFVVDVVATADRGPLLFFSQHYEFKLLFISTSYSVRLFLLFSSADFFFVHISLHHFSRVGFLNTNFLDECWNFTWKLGSASSCRFASVPPFPLITIETASAVCPLAGTHLRCF